MINKPHGIVFEYFIMPEIFGRVPVNFGELLIEPENRFTKTPNNPEDRYYQKKQYPVVQKKRRNRGDCPERSKYNSVSPNKNSKSIK